MTHVVPGRHRAPTRFDLLFLSTRSTPRRPAMALAASGGLVATALFGGTVPDLPPPSAMFGSVVAELPRQAELSSAFFSAYDARSPEAQQRASRASAPRAAVTRAVPTEVPASAVLAEPAVATVPEDAPVVAAAAPADGEVELDQGEVLAFTGSALPTASSAQASSSDGTAPAATATGSSAASGSSGTTSAPSAPAAAPAAAPQTSVASGSGAGETAIGWAMNRLGLPYGVGATGPGAYDCSGFTQGAFGAAGVYLPQGSGAQYAATRRVPLSQIRRGDLLFYSGRSGIYHVAIYLGNGQVVHALRDWSGGFSGSKVTGMYYSPGLMGAGRP